MVDLDTPYHLDHVMDDVLNAGCKRCARFFSSSREEWQQHRRRLLTLKGVDLEKVR